jgi:hypothetical protein
MSLKLRAKGAAAAVEIVGMPGLNWPSGLAAAVEAAHPMVEVGPTSGSVEASLLK